MWPNKVVRQFQAVPVNPVESDFHGAYNKLLYTLFPADSDYTVIPRYPKHGPPLSAGRIVTFEVFLENKPVFILELKKPADLKLISARELADTQIRQRMADLRSNCPIPTLHAISAMGTALCFYSVDTKTPDAKIIPRSIPRKPDVINDTAPKERWNLDVFSAEGENKFLSVVEEIKQACAALEALDSSLN